MLQHHSQCNSCSDTRLRQQTNNSEEVPMCSYICYIIYMQKWPLEIYDHMRHKKNQANVTIIEAYPRPQKSWFSLLTWINPPFVSTLFQHCFNIANVTLFRQMPILYFLWLWKSWKLNCDCENCGIESECESCNNPFLPIKLYCDLPNWRNIFKFKFKSNVNVKKPLWLTKLKDKVKF